ncbi:GroES-like protein [Ganoderma leucocontextum]|nr:GroES-like protein [Ganoderma leucocontextum]
MTPTTQKAPLVSNWLGVPLPDPTLVSAALNPVDAYTQAVGGLKLGLIHDYPLVNGADGAGVIEYVGAEVMNVATSDKVCLGQDDLPTMFQECTVQPATHVAKIQDNIRLKLDQAATVFATAVSSISAHEDDGANSVWLTPRWEKHRTTKYVGQAALTRIPMGRTGIGQYGFSPIATTSSLKHEARDGQRFGFSLLAQGGAFVTVNPRIEEWLADLVEESERKGEGKSVACVVGAAKFRGTLTGWLETGRSCEDVKGEVSGTKLIVHPSETPY